MRNINWLARFFEGKFGNQTQANLPFQNQHGFEILMFGSG